MSIAQRTLDSAYNYFKLVRTANTRIGYRLTLQQVAVLNKLSQLIDNYPYVCFALMLRELIANGVTAHPQSLSTILNSLLDADLISKRRTGYGKMLYSITLKGQAYLETLRKAA